MQNAANIKKYIKKVVIPIHLFSLIFSLSLLRSYVVVVVVVTAAAAVVVFADLQKF